MKDKVLGHRYITTLWRILDSGPAKNKYGYKLENKKLTITNAELFKKELSAIVTDVSNKKDKSEKGVDSRALRTNLEKEEYLERLSNTNNKSKKTEKKDNPHSAVRKYLIPEDFSIFIGNKRINNIYVELKERLPLNGLKVVPNAVGVLFRVFLETSLDHYYLKKQGEPFSRMPIHEKIKMVADYMEKEKIATFDELEHIRAPRNERSYLSIKHFHKFVHSDTEHPESSDLKSKWDNLQGFFEILWNDLEDK